MTLPSIIIYLYMRLIHRQIKSLCCIDVFLPASVFSCVAELGRVVLLKFALIQHQGAWPPRRFPAKSEAKVLLKTMQYFWLSSLKFSGTLRTASWNVETRNDRFSSSSSQSSWSRTCGHHVLTIRPMEDIAIQMRYTQQMSRFTHYMQSLKQVENVFILICVFPIIIKRKDIVQRLIWGYLVNIASSLITIAFASGSSTPFWSSNAPL